MTSPGTAELLWYAALPAFPLLAVQGWHARRTTPRLAEAAGPRHGRIGGSGQPLRLVVAGESPVAGVGIARQEMTVGCRAAAHLARSTGRPVDWYALGINGIRIEGFNQRLLPRIHRLQPDLVAVVLGVNDTTGLTARARWRQRLQQLRDSLREAHIGPVLFTGVPPIERFTAVPRPLRQVLGSRARQLDRDVAAICDQNRVIHLPTELPSRPEFLADDGFHPSALASDHFGRTIAERLVSALQSGAA